MKLADIPVSKGRLETSEHVRRTGRHPSFPVSAVSSNCKSGVIYWSRAEGLRDGSYFRVMGGEVWSK